MSSITQNQTRINQNHYSESPFFRKPKTLRKSWKRLKRLKNILTIQAYNQKSIDQNYPLALTYKPLLPNINKILTKHWNKLHINTPLQELFQIGIKRN